MKIQLSKDLINFRGQRNKSWKGIKAEYTGRPGTCTLLNKKRFFPVSELQKENDSNNKLLVDAFIQLSDLENKRKSVKSSIPGQSSSMNSANTTNALSSAPSKISDSYSSKLITKSTPTAKLLSDLVSFTPIKEHQYVTSPPSTGLYTRGTAPDYSELTYKLLK